MASHKPATPAPPPVPIPSTEPGKDGRSPKHPGESSAEPMLSRRSFVKNVVRLAVAGAILPGVMSQVLPAVAPDALGAGGGGPIIRRENGRKIPVTAADLKPQPENQPFVGEWNFLPAIVYMVKMDTLKASAQKRGYNTAQFAVPHPDNDSYAILVYRGKCKHLGCTVGWNGALGGSADVEDYNGDGINEGRILCPCHQGQYDIYDLALNVPGTPPPAPLDVVRIGIAPSYTDPNGKIEAGSKVIMGTELVPQAGPRQADLDSKAGNTTFVPGSQAATEV